MPITTDPVIPIWLAYHDMPPLVGVVGPLQMTYGTLLAAGNKHDSIPFKLYLLPEEILLHFYLTLSNAFP